MKEKWKYFTPEFECDVENEELLRYAPWSGHRVFAYDYVQNIKPTHIVELGSHYGCSSFAFLQAIKDSKLESDFVAIDTWEGDRLTRYGNTENVYDLFKRVKNICYGELSCTMLKNRFEEVVDCFEDESIDLLHIDGSHEYDDVKKDFLMWKKKVKKNGAIFFHDIAPEYVEGSLMGSHYFWKELCTEYSYTIEFPFSYGLGVLFFSEEKYIFAKNSIDMQYYQNINNTYMNVFADKIRKMHFISLNNNLYINDLKNQIDIKEEHLIKYKRNIEGKDEYINELEKEKINLENILRISEQESNIRNEYIEKLEKESNIRKEYIVQLEKNITNLENVLRNSEEETSIRNKYIESLKKEIADVKNILYIERETKEVLNERIEELSVIIKEKDTDNKKLYEEVNIKTHEIAEIKKRYNKTIEYKIRKILKCR